MNSAAAHADAAWGLDRLLEDCHLLTKSQIHHSQNELGDDQRPEKQKSCLQNTHGRTSAGRENHR